MTKLAPEAKSTRTTNRFADPSLPSFMSPIVKKSSCARTGSSLTEVTVDCWESSSVGSGASGGAQKAAIDNAVLSTEPKFNRPMAAVENSSPTEPENVKDDDDTHEDELEIEDVFVDRPNRSSMPDDFTCSFSARGVPRRPKPGEEGSERSRRGSSTRSSLTAAALRGVPQRESKDGEGADHRSTPRKNLDGVLNISKHIQTRSSPNLARLNADEKEKELTRSERPVPVRGLSRRSSMKKGEGTERRSTMQFSGEIQVYLPGKLTPVIKRRSISFNKNVVIRPIAPAIELTDKPDELWVQREELKRIHEISMDLIAKRFQDDYDDDQEDEIPESEEDNDDNCVRGLEALIDVDLKLERKYDAWDSVLNEQDYQRNEGTYDDHDIAVASQLSTAECSKEALERAKQDEDEVRLYLRGA